MAFAAEAQKVLVRQVALATQLVDLLKQEYEILRQSKTEELEKFAAQKGPIIQDLEQVNLAWQNLLKGVKAEFTLDGIQKALEQADPKQEFELVKLWNQLADTTRQCQKQNSINGAVLTLRSQITEQALAILRGQNPSEETTYEASGRRTQLGSGGTIGKA